MNFITEISLLGSGVGLGLEGLVHIPGAVILSVEVNFMCMLVCLHAYNVYTGLHVCTVCTVSVYTLSVCVCASRSQR